MSFKLVSFLHSFPVYGTKSPVRIEPNFLEEDIPDESRVSNLVTIGSGVYRFIWVYQGWGSSFAFSNWLLRSSLQHSHTTVWACDWFMEPASMYY